MDERVSGYECSSCFGIWISSSDYSDWIEKNKIDSEASTISESEGLLPAIPERKALLCADCGTILKRYKIWPNIEFFLDRCGNCNGIWLDKGEWEVIASKGDLIKNLNFFFTDEWQKKLKKEELKIRREKMYQERFGTDDYKKAKEIHQWIHSNPNKNQLLAYLMDSNPYEG